MWNSLSDHRNGLGFYADPLGKPSLLTHWRGLVEFSYSTVSLSPKQTTEEGLAAASSPSSSDDDSTEWDGDGVKVPTGKQKTIGLICAGCSVGCCSVDVTTAVEVARCLLFVLPEYLI